MSRPPTASFHVVERSLKPYCAVLLVISVPVLALFCFLLFVLARNGETGTTAFWVTLGFAFLLAVAIRKATGMAFGPAHIERYDVGPEGLGLSRSLKGPIPWDQIASITYVPGSAFAALPSLPYYTLPRIVSALLKPTPVLAVKVVSRSHFGWMPTLRRWLAIVGVARSTLAIDLNVREGPEALLSALSQFKPVLEAPHARTRIPSTR